MAQALYEAFLAALAESDVSPLEAIGVLELVKAELMASLDEGDDETDEDAEGSDADA